MRFVPDGFVAMLAAGFAALTLMCTVVLSNCGADVPARSSPYAVSIMASADLADDFALESAFVFETVSQRGQLPAIDARAVRSPALRFGRDRNGCPSIVLYRPAPRTITASATGRTVSTRTL